MADPVSYRSLFGVVCLLSLSAPAVAQPMIACDADCCGRISAVEVSGTTDIDTRALITCEEEFITAPAGAVEPSLPASSVSCYTRNGRMIDLAIQGLAQNALVGLDYRSQWRANWCSSVELVPAL